LSIGNLISKDRSEDKCFLERVETDASDYALAAILSIVNEDNEVHLVAFHSHTFTMVELNYNTHDKELLAIFEAFKIW